MSFAAFGPAAETDFRYYLGVTAAGSKAAVARLVAAGDLVAVQVRAGGHVCDSMDQALVGEGMLVTRACIGRLAEVEAAAVANIAATAPEVHVVGRFDVLALGHVDKAWLVPPAMKCRVWSRNADVSALVLVSGRAVGTWHGKLAATLDSEDCGEKSSKGERDGTGLDYTHRLEVTIELFEGTKLMYSERGCIEEKFRSLAQSFYRVPFASVSIKMGETE